MLEVAPADTAILEDDGTTTRSAFLSSPTARRASIRSRRAKGPAVERAMPAVPSPLGSHVRASAAA
eukprot:7748213-Pyramimonas_sp.AAC.1